MNKILVTGGAGFIGAHLTQKLVEQNHKVMVVDTITKIGGIPFINPRCNFLKGDITSSKTIKKIEKWKPKIIFHLAAQSGGESAYDDPKKDYLSNGYGTYLLSIMAKKINVKHFIYTSSVAVYGSNPKKKITEKTNIDPDSIYGISKYIGEMFISQVLQQTKIKTTIFRVFNTYGPGENLNFMKKGMVSIYSSFVWKKKPIIVKGSLKRFRNLNYIEDTVNILINSLKNKNLKKNEIINLTSGKIFTVKKLIKEILLTKNYKKYKIVIAKGTPGDSFGWNASSRYIEKKFNNYKFTDLKIGLKKYFKWIDKLPVNKNLKNHHPLEIKRKNEL